MLVATSAWAGADQRQKPTDDFPSDVASVWFDTLYDVIKSEATAPPPASRIYGVAAVPSTRQSCRARDTANRWWTSSTAGCGATAQGAQAVPLAHGGQRRAGPHDPRPLPVAEAQNLEAINALEQRFASQFHAEVKQHHYKRAVAHGQAVADALLAWAATDGSRPPTTARMSPRRWTGAWEPTPPLFNPNPLSPVGASSGRWP